MGAPFSREGVYSAGFLYQANSELSVKVCAQDFYPKSYSSLLPSLLKYPFVSEKTFLNPFLTQPGVIKRIPPEHYLN
jgi:hypothetical protein